MAEKGNTAGPPMKGGTKDFNWQGVKNMSYRDRESYLGYTVKIGYLEKGAKWNKSDWWIQGKDGSGPLTPEQEIQMQKDKDEKMMRIALGLEEREEEFELPKMTAEEAKFMTDKMRMEAEEEGPDESRDIVPGLGYQAANVNLNKERSKNAIKDFDGALRLEGVGIEDLLKIEKQKTEKLKALEREHTLKQQEKRKEGKQEDNDSIIITSKKIKKEKKKKEKKSKKDKKDKSKKKDKTEKEKLYKLYKI